MSLTDSDEVQGKALSFRAYKLMRLNMGAGRLNIIVGLAFCLKSVCILHVTDRL